MMKMLPEIQVIITNPNITIHLLILHTMKLVIITHNSNHTGNVSHNDNTKFDPFSADGNNNWLSDTIE